ncbi:hypothetical protein H5410_036550 [Solanum commersonii]|uniref:Uncharacterized protein n=1 Tax=Solanum commersonii TaxID=4109 RepID=A0A9J5Y8H7_SOLCO|nr:hypothetical protein H5410_036550 [Solanum commersonii]
MVCIRIGVRFHLTPRRMFNEFKKYYVWAPEHEDDVQVNFKLKASKLLSSTFCDCRRENRMPGFMVPDRWALYLETLRS